MQFDATAHAALKKSENRGKRHKKTGLNEPVNSHSLTPRGASCSTPPALKTSFNTDGVIAGLLIVKNRLNLTCSHVDSCRYGLFYHATICICAAKRCFYNGMRVFIQNQVVDR